MSNPLKKYFVEAQRERRAKLKAEGKCVQCGKREPKEGKVTCQVCIDKIAGKPKALKFFASWAEVDGEMEQIGEVSIMEDGKIVVNTQLGFDVTEEQVMRGDWEDLTNV